MVTIFFALSAAISYGAADFFGGLATRKASIFSVVIPVQAVGLPLLLLALPLTHSKASAASVVTGVLAGLCGGAGLALLYRALAIGKMGIVSPITAVLAAAFPLVLGLLRGENLNPVQIVGLAAGLAAVVLMSASVSDGSAAQRGGAGMKEAVASGVLLGGFYILLGLSPGGSGVYPLVWARLTSALMLAAIAAAARKSVVPPPPVRGLVLAGGALDTAANGLYLAAAMSGYISIAAVLTSLYPGATVLMARFFLGERLRAWQTAGVYVALAAVVLIAWKF